MARERQPTTINQSKGGLRRPVEEERRRAIEETAYAVLAEVGYRRASMLLIAKRANASNQTLYRWYGSKQGLFRALIQRNTEEAIAALQSTEAHDLDARMVRFGSVLLRMLTGDRAVALGRAAAADATETGELGQEVARSGRARLVPLLHATFENAQQAGKLQIGSAEEATERYLALLIGDLQVRRVTGALPPLPTQEIDRRAEAAWRDVCRR